MTEKRCDCEVCADSATIMRMARDMEGLERCNGRPAHADVIASLLHLLMQTPAPDAEPAPVDRVRRLVAAVVERHRVAGYQRSAVEVCNDVLLVLYAAGEEE